MIEETTCPECGGPMVSRNNTQTGQRFWGCRAYPSCRGTRNTDGEAAGEARHVGGPVWPTDVVDQAPSDRARQHDRARWRQP